jgi:uncharacterized protein YodC (DUF2158 family)
MGYTIMNLRTDKQKTFTPLNVGDIVKIKNYSFSSTMVIEEIKEGKIKAIWFDKNFNLQEHWFNHDLLYIPQKDKIDIKLFTNEGHKEW